MYVYLVQHEKAKTEEQDPERPLNQEGERDVEKIGRHLAAHGIKPDSIRHSGKLRARQTAEFMARHLDPANTQVRYPASLQKTTLLPSPA